MKCNRCQYDDTKVIESRDAADGVAIRRRRMCMHCKYRFTTYERVERPQLVVIKNNGSRELFSRDKLLAGLHRATEKTSVTGVQLEALVSELEDYLYGIGESDIRSSQIGELVMQRLAALNEVAYVRFASVYRRFKDIAGFERELATIKKQRKPQKLVK